jgi:large subunit ribosomal protein L28
MSRKCQITGKAVLSGNNRSHAENKTRRKFLPNIQDTRLYSEALGRWVALKVTTSGLRTVEHNGGLDAFLTKTAVTKLDPKLRKIKVAVKKALAEKAAA